MKKITSLLLVLAMIFSLSSTSFAVCANFTEDSLQNEKTTNWTVGDEMIFERAVEIAENFLEKNNDGTLKLNLPRKLIEQIGLNTYEQLQYGLLQTNKMVLSGYLEFDVEFNIITKYNCEIVGNILVDKGLDLSNKESIISLNGSSHKGVSKIDWHWWGFELYLDYYDTIDLIDGGSVASIMIAFIPKAGPVLAAIVGVNTIRINRYNRRGKGIVLSFSWFSGGNLLVRNIRPQ